MKSIDRKFTMSLFTLDKNERQIPSNSGIYLMKDKTGKIIYIGKAKNLKNRIKSYYNLHHKNTYNNKDRNFEKTRRMVNKVYDIEFILTDNEIEAFLLESNLIKRYRPIFNIELKDQQRYTYLKITDERFPRLLVARRNSKGDFQGPNGDIYGPIVYGSSRFLSLGIIRKIFKIRICDRLPKSPCLEYFINNCDAPCIGKISEQKYYENINKLKEIFSKRNSLEDLISHLKIEMNVESKQQNYERAKEIRDTIKTIESLLIKQKMDSKYRTNEEYIGIKTDILTGKDHILIFKRVNGVINDRRKYEYEHIGDNNFSTFLFQYYSTLQQIPEEIYVNEFPPSKTNLELALTKLANHEVKIIKVVTSSKNGKKDLMDLILRNLSNQIQSEYNPSVIELKNLLTVKEFPFIIDCFDVSNFGITYAVGACVRFVNGYPYKNGYKRFKIRTIRSKQDDYSMIKEIVYRKYSTINNFSENEATLLNNTINSTKNNKLEKSLPNLIVIDGGKGQLRSAEIALKKIGLKIPIISLAKENEEIYTIGSPDPLQISKKNIALHLLQSLRDESHRFGLAYNVKLREIQ
ncbi:MAG TPA: excinuclease ABC subunit UvrC [Nitrososphaeraceae archaeon]|nr:excinuclease ABC subunit UvrC [Nitrososphaeraceae archaeon]